MSKKEKMKKYKLIKDYPGCDCDLGTIVQYQDRTYPPYFDIKTGIRYSHEIVEKYPEFWEEVVEKDYEILEINGYSGRYFLNPKTGYMSYGGNGDGMYNAEYYLNSSYHHYIVSVKRLSDGEIFTLGDRITGKSDYNCIIHSIELNPEYPQIMFNKLDEGIDLINAKHIRKPLFTTEDGVDIYEGDSYWYVDEEIELFFSKKAILTSGKDMFFKYFSTKEAAEEYILMNKPCLSINDVLNSQDGTMFLEKKLKILVKSKL